MYEKYAFFLYNIWIDDIYFFVFCKIYNNKLKKIYYKLKQGNY